MKPDVIKIPSHTGIAAAIPYLLGFHPTDSLVVIGLEGPQDRIAFTMRIDLPPVSVEAAVVCEVTRRMRPYEHVIVAVYTDDDAAELPRRGLVERLLRVLDARDALLVRDHRVWSYLCTDPSCCPPEGRPYADEPDAVDLAAAHALRGRRPLANRQAVIDALRPPRPDDAEDVLRRLPVKREALASVSTDDRVGELTRLMAVTLARLDDPRAELTADEVAQFLALLDHVQVRDVFIGRLATTDDPAGESLIRQLTSKTPACVDAEVCAARAFLAYLHGDGVVASAAAGRALTRQPGHSLASLIDQAVTAGIDPAALRAALSLDT